MDANAGVIAEITRLQRLAWRKAADAVTEMVPSNIGEVRQLARISGNRVGVAKSNRAKP